MLPFAKDLSIDRILVVRKNKFFSRVKVRVVRKKILFLTQHIELELGSGLGIFRQSPEKVWGYWLDVIIIRMR
jgi:hypothetical protein